MSKHHHIKSDKNSPTHILHIYPNPFSEQATLLIGSTHSNITLQVENCYGAIVYQENINGPMAVLERQHLPAGIYFVQLKQDSKIIAKEKIVITD